MRVKVKAIAVGTRVGNDGTQIHTNPKGSDPLAREPIIDSKDIAILLEQPPLIADPGKKLKAFVAPGAGAVDLTRVDELAAANVSAIAEIDDAAGGPPSGLGHRESVHYDPAQGVGAGADGIAAGDPDAPPGNDLHGADAIDENMTAAGTTVSNGEPAKPASQGDGSISGAPAKKGKAKS